MTKLAEIEFYAHVAGTIRANPQWMSGALNALCDGMSAAITDANERRATTDAAFLAALSLASNRGRVSKQVRDALNPVILRAIDPANASAVEKAFIQGAKT